MPPKSIAAELARAGFGDIRLYGDHTRKPLDADADESLIVVATRV
jgi:hypothetical protein